MRIDGQVAAVFGGASGLGEATARRLAAGGAKVLIADLAAERAAALAAEIGGAAVECDVADADSVEDAVAMATELGDLRIAVDCAGIATPTKLVRKGRPTPLEDFAKVIAVNLLGTINVLRCAAAAMVQNEPGIDGDRGVCVVTASIAAYEGQIGQVAYAASKAGVAGLTLPVARELADRAVRVVAIAPGLFDTPLLAGLPAAARESLAGSVPYPSRLGDPAEYAALVEHIALNTMINGETIRLDGALRMGPG
ncbi:MAG TPA: SDR family NAD(P)-dependent oxidoreductase [Solirubrobacterales bacterium]|nr:SDR family NAD(P)-dependent oxidoreductase [Solirubrobacterales bacterium]